MEELKIYFKDQVSYNKFINGLRDQLANISFGNRANVIVKNPPFLGASIPLHVEGSKGTKMGSYWLKIEKMGKASLDNF